MLHYSLPPSLQQLIVEFSKLPGIGQKSAQRFAFYLLKQDTSRLERFGQVVSSLKENLQFCSVCENITEKDICSICTNTKRDEKSICVVEEILDLLALESMGRYQGRYHVLHGIISPMEGVSHQDLKITSLISRCSQGDIREVILATNPTIEGEATAAYISKKLEPFSVHITRLARGLPAGSDLEYADAITLERALIGRQEF